ncbi:hypothetical protein QWY22_15460 [Planococcus liqunii]|uniref:Group-specific protein n=1 Tax=Planococcus liqunii TaxID=3058394 RepID=A0ABT8MNQ1_9BACL|nr:MULTISPECIES: hypothetical protein [unclassified Planococcus (in: firmicutes)]MDN7226505.1 hypothetical protein [Planococcus sp. N064]WKA50285.1 hypothetical protein QWY22_15460 [Planococcus sp. N056]
MYKTLPVGVKSSITRSITKMFEKYMSDIEWKEDLFKLEDFVKVWQDYINSNAQWNEKVPLEVKVSPLFHEEVASKMNQVINKVLTEVPSEEQVSRIESMQQSIGTNYDYSCKAEATYIEKKLENMSVQKKEE